MLQLRARRSAAVLFRLLTSALGIASAVLLFIAPRPILHHMTLPDGTYCGSAISSSMMHASAFGGPPPEAVLDPDQAQCKELGRGLVDEGLKRYEALALSIILLIALVIAGDAYDRTRNLAGSKAMVGPRIFPG